MKVEGKRYVVCRNEAEAENDRKDREAIVAALDAQLKKGDKALIGNSAYRRYLRKTGGRAGLRDRRRQARRGSTLRWHLRVAHQRQDHAAAGGAAISRFAAGRKPLPANQGDHAHAADLPFLRRRHTRPRLLFLPRARHAEVPRRSRRARPASCRNGRRFCAISIACNRCASAIATPIGLSAPTSRSRSPISSTTPTSPCRRAPGKWRHRNSRPPPNPPGNAAAAPGVVPRRHEFRRKQRDLNRLRKSGVQVGPKVL